MEVHSLPELFLPCTIGRCGNFKGGERNRCPAKRFTVVSWLRAWLMGVPVRWLVGSLVGWFVGCLLRPLVHS